MLPQPSPGRSGVPPQAPGSRLMSPKELADALEDAFQQARDMDAPLGERLAFIADAVRSLNASFAEAVDRLVIRLQQSGAGASAPDVGDPMPPFVLPDDGGRLV